MDEHWDILVGTPVHQYYGSYRFRDALDNCLAYTHSKGFTIKQVWRQSSLLPRNRINIVRDAQKYNCNYVMQFDNDEVFDKDTIVRLLKHNKDIVSGLYFSKTFPHKPVMMRGGRDYKYDTILEWNHGDLIEVDACGGGALLVKTEIFNKLPRPWFCNAPLYLYYDGEKKIMRINHDYYENKELDNNEVVGEDVWFCHIARQSGHKIYVDTATMFGHLGEHIFADEEFGLAKEQGAYKDCKLAQ